jgi:hypothetical protein
VDTRYQDWDTWQIQGTVPGPGHQMDIGIRTRKLGGDKVRTGTPDENKVPRLGHQVVTR